jgi:ketosteroid isomerase-like protein
MASANVATVETLYAAITDDGIDLASAQLISEEAVYDWSRRKLDPIVVRGRDSILAALRDLIAPWEPYSVEVEQLFDLGDRVLALAIVRGRGRASGIELSSRVAHLWEFRDEKVVAMVYYPEREEALAELGLRQV